jgi:DNA-binding transcriptional LysR family regulator
MLQNFERLKVFYYVFSEKSVVAASKTLNVSQSAVSQALQKLEGEIRCPLFTRLHKRLVPTDAGQRLFTVMRPFMAELDACLKTLEQAKDQPFGELRIGAPVEFGKAYFPAIEAAMNGASHDIYLESYIFETEVPSQDIALDAETKAVAAPAPEGRCRGPEDRIRGRHQHCR